MGLIFERITELCIYITTSGFLPRYRHYDYGIGFNLLGDGLRDALDPRLNRN